MSLYPMVTERGMSLFWRTYVLLLLWLAGSVMAWSSALHAFAQAGTGHAVIWFLASLVLSLLGAAWLAGLSNRPIKALSFAASRFQDGEFQASTLDETVSSHELRTVNVGFNRMSQKLAHIEHDRAVMLAGISHDLRTPLSRLRLETELSVSNAAARAHMVDDIEQIDAIIGKFMDYARPDEATLGPVSLNATIERCIKTLHARADMRFKLSLTGNLMVKADDVELQRVINNLLENAVRYGKSVDTGITLVEISSKKQQRHVIVRIRDHGAGVSDTQLKQLTTPFFRGDSARTQAKGAGLGLAIVAKTLARMGGQLDLSNAADGGFCATMILRAAVRGDVV